MSDICKAIRTYLLTKPSVATLVGTRIYPDILPQHDGNVTVDLPAVTLEVVSGSSESDLSGGIGLAKQRVSATCYAATRSAANGLAEAVRKNMLAIRGNVGSEHIRSVTCESRVYLTDPPIDASDQWRYLCAVDFEVIHGEAVAALA